MTSDGMHSLDDSGVQVPGHRSAVRRAEPASIQGDSPCRRAQARATGGGPDSGRPARATRQSAHGSREERHAPGAPRRGASRGLSGAARPERQRARDGARGAGHAHPRDRQGASGGHDGHRRAPRSLGDICRPDSWRNLPDATQGRHTTVRLSIDPELLADAIAIRFRVRTSPAGSDALPRVSTASARRAA